MNPAEIIELEKLSIMLYHEKTGEIAPAWQDLAHYVRDELRSEAYRMRNEMKTLSFTRGWRL